MSLGILMIIFIVISVLSILGVVSLWISKNEKNKRMIYIFLVVWSILISILNFGSLPTNFLLERIISIAIGLVGILSIIPYRLEKIKLAEIIVSLTVIAGVIDTFIV